MNSTSAVEISTHAMSPESIGLPLFGVATGSCGSVSATFPDACWFVNLGRPQEGGASKHDHRQRERRQAPIEAFEGADEGGRGDSGRSRGAGAGQAGERQGPIELRGKLAEERDVAGRERDRGPVAGRG